MTRDELKARIERAKAARVTLSDDDAADLALMREAEQEEARTEKANNDAAELAIMRITDMAKAKFPDAIVEHHSLGKAGHVVLRSNPEAYDDWNKGAKDDEAKKTLFFKSLCGSVPPIETLRDNVQIRFKASLDSALNIVHRLNGMVVDAAFLKSISGV